MTAIFKINCVGELYKPSNYFCLIEMFYLFYTKDETSVDTFRAAW